VAVLELRVQPRASKTELVGWHGGALKVRLTAPPAEGAANEALIALLAEVLGVRRAEIRILSGQTGRQKRVAIDTLDDAALAQRIAQALSSGTT
jgi:uncharacterized protein (TIGR00251 family)